MKNLRNTRWLLLLIFSQNSNAQTVNLHELQNSQHFINASVGWDYGLTYGVGYGYRLKSKVPTILNSNFSIPSGKKLFDDFKFKPGIQVVVLNRTKLKASISATGIYRRYGNPLVQLQNVGSEIKASLGYYRTSWFIAGEFGLDKAIVTHFKHSESFRLNVYKDIQDGWYRPATGGNFIYGLQSGYSFKQFDVTLNLGKVVAQDLKSSPIIPYYMTLGATYKI